MRTADDEQRPWRQPGTGRHRATDDEDGRHSEFLGGAERCGRTATCAGPARKERGLGVAVMDKAVLELAVDALETGCARDALEQRQRRWRRGVRRRRRRHARRRRTQRRRRPGPECSGASARLAGRAQTASGTCAAATMPTLAGRAPALGTWTMRSACPRSTRTCTSSDAGCRRRGRTAAGRCGRA